MKKIYHIAPYIRSFFEDHLVRRRNLSDNTIWSYRDAIKLLIQFVTHRTGKSAPVLNVTDISEQIVLDFLKYCYTVLRLFHYAKDSGGLWMNTFLSSGGILGVDSVAMQCDDFIYSERTISINE